MALVVAYLTPFALLHDVYASATACNTVPYQCISEGAPGWTRLYAGQISSTFNKHGVLGNLVATATTLTQPTQNGFVHWYGVYNSSLPPGSWGISSEWMQGGYSNGIFNGNSGYPQNSDYNWYSEFLSWCNGYVWTGHGGYTPNSTQTVKVYEIPSTYDCGSGGATTVYLFVVYFNTSLAKQAYLLESGAAYRVDANTEYYPYDYLNPVAIVCYGKANASAGCSTNDQKVQRYSGTTWSDWGSSETTFMNQQGYSRTNITTNSQFKVTSTY